MKLLLAFLISASASAQYVDTVDIETKGMPQTLQHYLARLDKAADRFYSNEPQGLGPQQILSALDSASKNAIHFLVNSTKVNPKYIYLEVLEQIPSKKSKLIQRELEGALTSQARSTLKWMGINYPDLAAKANAAISYSFHVNLIRMNSYEGRVYRSSRIPSGLQTGRLLESSREPMFKFVRKNGKYADVFGSGKFYNSLESSIEYRKEQFRKIVVGETPLRASTYKLFGSNLLRLSKYFR